MHNGLARRERSTIMMRGSPDRGITARWEFGGFRASGSEWTAAFAATGLRCLDYHGSSSAGNAVAAGRGAS